MKARRLTKHYGGRYFANSTAHGLRGCVASRHIELGFFAATARGGSMLIPSPKWLDSGANAWQMAAATFVALQSIPGLVILYGGIVQKKVAGNSAFMSIYAFVAVMIVWVL